MRRIIVLLGAFIITVVVVIKQPANSPHEPIHDVEELWEQHIENIKGQLQKTDRPDEFAKYQWMIRTRAGSTMPEYAPNYKVDQLTIAFRNSSSARARQQQLDFIERGPGNVPGRSRALLVLPSDLTGNTWIAGAVGGGIWRTDNAGSSWTNLTPDLPSLAVTTLVMSSSDPNIMYAGTGESFAGISGTRGDGIFKSIDGGFSWSQLTATATNDNFQNVNRIIIHPTNPNILLACTSNDPNFSSFQSGIFKSIDGGDSWTNVFDASRRVQQLIASPDNFNVVYATLNNGGVIKSNNQGDTWFPSSNGLIPDGRIEIAISSDNPDRIFASVEGVVSGSESDLYISEDAGANWELVLEENGGENLDFLGGQGNYDNCIAVHPYNDDIVYVGGVNLFKFTVKPGTGQGQPTVLGVDPGDTDQFMDFVNFDNGVFFESKLAIGDADPDDFVSIEWRFGPGLTQMAHRFEVPADGGTNGDGGAGVPDEDYTYQDYVEVPFEVWDIDNNRQLMVSFRDQQRDGTFNLDKRDGVNDPGLLNTREYFFAHAIAYSENPEPSIMINGGHEVQQMYFMWPVLEDDADPWDPQNLPDSKLTINYGSVMNRFRETTIVSDAFNQLPGSNGVNRFFQSFGEDNTANLGLHPDHHQITIQEMNPASETFRMIVTNDGGVYYTSSNQNPGENNGDWIFAGNGYNTSQFYGVDKKPGAMEFIGGMQDNGTYRSPEQQEANSGSAYVRQIGGDGFKTVWHYTNPDMIIGSSQYNGFRRTTDGGASWTSGTSGLSDVGEDNAPFISWLANSKKSPNILFAVGRQGVWRSPDFGASWNLTPINGDWAFNNLSRVVISEADPTVVWAGSGMTSIARLHLSEDSGNTFTEVNNYAGSALGNISNIATHPTQRRTAYALFSFSDAPKILRTTDGGQNWEDITGFENNSESSNGFPDVPVFSLLVLPNEPFTIWAGTEIGLVESTDNGSTWALRDDFINTAIWEMKAVDDQVVIGTHGRGIWTVTMEGLSWPSELVTSVDDPIQPFELAFSNYPNPVSTNTTFKYSIPNTTAASIDIIDSQGKAIHRQDLGIVSRGEGAFTWFRHPVMHSSGIYIARLTTESGTVSSTMILE